MKNTTRTAKTIGTGVRKEACVIDNLVKFTPLPHQEAVKNYFLKSKYRGLLLYHALGSGKCMKIDTPIMLNDGKIKMVQDIKVGDLLMGDDSTPRTVTSLARGEDEMYEIIPVKGDSYTVNQEHILCLKASGYPRINHINDRNNTNYNVQYIENNKFMSKTFSYKRNDIDDEEKKKEQAENFFNNISHDNIMEMSVIEYLKLPKHRKDCLKTYRVPVEFPEQKVTIDPYMIGYWLGDGTSNKSQITTEDKEVVNYFEKFCHDNNHRLHQGKRSITTRHDFHYTLYGSINGKPKSNIFLNSLKENNLINNKHIPDIYKYNSRENRLKLLAGLIDSDGSLGKGCFEFSQSVEKEKLFDDVMYLARSLGFACYKSKKETICKDEKGNIIEGEAWRMHISGSGIEEIPTKIQRKQAKIRKQIKDVLVSGIEVKHVGRDNYYGFTLDGNCRYLLGDFTVTHNTCTSIIIAEEMLSEGMIQRVYVCTPGSLRKNFTYEYCTLCGVKDNLKKYYTFITYNTSIFKTLKRINFNNSLVIIDEAHNLINGAKNITLNPYSLYNQILNSNARVLILSGIVIYDKIFEWVILGNLLKSDTFPNIIETGHLRKEMFDNNIEEIFSKESLEGIISYFPGNADDYPQVINHGPIIVPMTSDQKTKFDTLKKVEVMLISEGPPTPEYRRINPIKAHYNHILYILAVKNIFTRAISNVNYAGINKLEIKEEERKDIYHSLPFPLKSPSTIRSQFEKNKPEPKTIETIIVNTFNIVAPTYEDIMKINDENLPEIVEKIIANLILNKFISYDEIKSEEIKSIVKNEIEKLKNIEKTDDLFEETIVTDDNEEQKEEVINDNLDYIYDMCNLCENPFVGAKNYIYQLPCGDVFHFECLKVYLKNNLKNNLENNSKVCPTCKQPFYGDIEKKYAKEYSYINIPDTLKKEDGTGGWVSHEILKNKMLQSISPKILTIILNILKNLDSKHVIFSFFLEKSGLRLIKSLFDLCNISSIIYHGDLKAETKENLIKSFNKKNNIYGNQYRVFLSTESGFEGITLKDVGHVHFLETNPLPNKTLQAIGRAVRYKSHENLPPEKKVVNIWKYYSTPVKYIGDDDKFNTTKSDLDTFDDYYGYYVNEEFKNYLSTKYGKYNIEYEVGVDEKLANLAVIKSKENEKFYNILKLNSIELQGQINATDNQVGDFIDQIINQNILYVCANDNTAELEIPKGQKFIEVHLKDPHINYYIGYDLKTNLIENKCGLNFGKDNIDICKFEVLFDIVVLEYCPIANPFEKFLSDKFFDDLNKILKDDGIVAIPLFKSDDSEYLTEKNSSIVSDFKVNNFELFNTKNIDGSNIHYFRKMVIKSKFFKNGELIKENTSIPQNYSGLIEEDIYEPSEQNVDEELIEEEGAQETKERDYEEEDLFNAILENNLNSVNKLIQFFPNLNFQNSQGFTPLMYACFYGHEKIVNALIMAGANVDARNCDGHTALMTASDYGDINIVNALIAASTNFNAQNDTGLTALMYASGSEALKKTDASVVNALIAAGANVDTQDRDGNTALMYASETNNTGAIIALILAGANVDLKDNEGEKAIDMTYKYETIDIIRKAKKIAKLEFTLSSFMKSEDEEKKDKKEDEDEHPLRRFFAVDDPYKIMKQVVNMVHGEPKEEDYEDEYYEDEEEEEGERDYEEEEGEREEETKEREEEEGSQESKERDYEE